MNAQEYYDLHANDGRAYLVRSQAMARVGRPPKSAREAWLVQICSQLILCCDAEYPMQRLVASDEEIIPHHAGGYRIARI